MNGNNPSCRIQTKVYFRGLHGTEVTYLLLTQHPLGSILGIPNNFSLDAAEIYRWHSGQRLDNVNRTHLVLASGKLVLQKLICCIPDHT